MVIYGNRTKPSLKDLQSAQNKTLKIVYNLPLRFPTNNLYKEKAQNLLYTYKSIKGLSRRSVPFRSSLLKTIKVTRQTNNLQILTCRIELTKQRVAFSGASEFNTLPDRLKKH